MLYIYVLRNCTNIYDYKKTKTPIIITFAELMNNQIQAEIKAVVFFIHYKYIIKCLPLQMMIIETITINFQNILWKFVYYI